MSQMHASPISSATTAVERQVREPNEVVGNSTPATEAAQPHVSGNSLFVAASELFVATASANQAAYLAVALRRQAQQLRRNGSRAPDWAKSLEVLLSRRGLGSPGITAVQEGSPLATLDISPNDEAMDPKPLLTRHEAARYLSVSAATLKRLEPIGRLVPIRIGSSVRYRREDLDRFIADERTSA